MVLSQVGVALARIGVALFEVGVERATPKVYKSPPLNTQHSPPGALAQVWNAWAN